MASTISWSGRSHLSIEGIEVVPANELEVAYDNSPPEVVAGQWINEKKRSVALQSLRRKRIDWRRRKVFGVPLLWIAIGVITFGIGIAMGSIVVSSVVSKDSRANSSQEHSPQPSIQSSSRTTFSDPFITTPGVSLKSAQTFIPSTQTFVPSTQASDQSTTTLIPVASTPTTVGAVETDQTNFQEFTGAIGGKAAAPVTATGNSSAPYATGGQNFADLATALARSCDNQHNDCEILVNANGGSEGYTGQDCDDQQADCIDANGGVLGTTDAPAAPTAAASTTDPGLYITMISLS